MTIPGTTKLDNLEDNLGAYEIRLSGDEQAALDQRADRVLGDRYDERGRAIIDAQGQPGSRYYLARQARKQRR